LKLQVRVSPGDVVLEPLIEKDVWRTEFPFNDLHNGSYELALFSAKRERHHEVLGKLAREHVYQYIHILLVRLKLRAAAWRQ
jgi:hypothetical protein